MQLDIAFGAIINSVACSPPLDALPCRISLALSLSGVPTWVTMAFIERVREKLSPIVYTGGRKETSDVSGHVPLRSQRQARFVPAIGHIFEQKKCLKPPS